MSRHTPLIAATTLLTHWPDWRAVSAPRRRAEVSTEALDAQRGGQPAWSGRSADRATLEAAWKPSIFNDGVLHGQSAAVLAGTHVH